MLRMSSPHALRIALLAFVALGRPLASQCPTDAPPDSVVELDSSQVVLRLTTVSRDFQPIRYPDSPDHGSDLRVVLALRNPRGGRVRVGGEIIRVWVRRDSNWSPLTLGTPWVSWDTIQVVRGGGGGPPWPVGSFVDVAVYWSIAGQTNCTLFHRITIAATS